MGRHRKPKPYKPKGKPGRPRIHTEITAKSKTPEYRSQYYFNVLKRGKVQ